MSLENEFLKERAAQADAELEEVKGDLKRQIEELREELKIANAKEADARLEITEIQEEFKVANQRPVLNKLNYLLVLLAEQSAKATAALTQAVRFDVNGPDNVRDHVVTELTGLYAIMEMVGEQEGGGLPGMCDPEQIRKKRKEVERMMEYSKARGTLADEK